MAAALGIGLAVWLVLGALTDLALRSGIGGVGPGVALRRLAGLPRSTYGTALAHLGLGLTVLGIVGVMSFQGERIVAMRQGDTAELAGYTLRFEGMRSVTGPNFTEDQGIFALGTTAGRDLGEIVSAKRIYPARQMPTTEAGIRTFGFSQLYVSLGDLTSDGGIVVRIWW